MKRFDLVGLDKRSVPRDYIDNIKDLNGGAVVSVRTIVERQVSFS